MIPSGLFSQIAIIILSIGIIVTYVKPTIDTIGAYQDQIGTYQTERQKVKEVNDTLSALASRVNNIDTESQRRLLTYLPDKIDTISVPRTIESIALEANVVLSGISHETAEDEDIESQYVEEGIAAEPTPDIEDFSVSFTGTYNQMKTFLRLTEQNEFPLETVKLEVLQADSGSLTVELLLRTYSHHPLNGAETVNIEQI